MGQVRRQAIADSVIISFFAKQARWKKLKLVPGLDHDLQVLSSYVTSTAIHTILHLPYTTSII